MKSIPVSKHHSYVQNKYPQLIKFLESLGYNLKNNFIFQKTKKVRNHINTSWTENKTTPFDNNLIVSENDLYNGKTKEYYKKNIYVSKISLIINHIFSDILSTDYHYSVIDNILESELAGKNINKINKNVGCYFKEKSNVLAIDIDNHDNKNTLLMLETYQATLDFFGKDNIIFQENSYSYGYHIFIKLNTALTISEKKKIIKDYKKSLHKYSKFIESPLKMRLPISYDYTVLDNKYTTGADYNNNSQNCIQETILAYNNSKGFDCESYSVNTTKEKAINEIYCRETVNNSLSNMTYEQFLQDEKFDLCSGERFCKMPFFVSFAKSHNLTEEECFDLVILKGKGSKDVLHNHKTIKSEIKSLYKSYNPQSIKYDVNKVQEYFSNIDKIPLAVVNKITHRKVLIQILVNTKQKVSNHNMEILKILLLEILGKFFYNLHNRKAIKSNNYTDKFLIGEQYSRNMCNLLKEKYEILKNVNVYKRISDILLYSCLFSQQFSNKKGYYCDYDNTGKSFCRQFYLKANKDKEIKFDIDRLILFIYESIDYLFNKIKTFSIVNWKECIFNSIKEINSIVHIFSEGKTVNHNIMNDFQFQKMKT